MRVLGGLEWGPGRVEEEENVTVVPIAWSYKKAAFSCPWGCRRMTGSGHLLWGALH